MPQKFGKAMGTMTSAPLPEEVRTGIKANIAVADVIRVGLMRFRPASNLILGHGQVAAGETALAGIMCTEFLRFISQKRTLTVPPHRAYSMLATSGITRAGQSV
jgi:hypothetical protein